MQLWYVGDPVQVGDTKLRHTGFPDNVARQWNSSYNYLYFNNGTWQQSPTQLRISRCLIPNAAVRTWGGLKTSGESFSLQSFFWKNRIVSLFGWRRDEVKQYLGTLLPANQFPFPALPGNSRADFTAPTLRYSNKRDTTTQSIVFKVTDQLRKMGRRRQQSGTDADRQTARVR